MENEPLNVGSPQASLNVGSLFFFFFSKPILCEHFPHVEPRVLLVLVF